MSSQGLAGSLGPQWLPSAVVLRSSGDVRALAAVPSSATRPAQVPTAATNPPA